MFTIADTFYSVNVRMAHCNKTIGMGPDIGGIDRTTGLRAIRKAEGLRSLRPCKQVDIYWVSGYSQVTQLPTYCTRYNVQASSPVVSSHLLSKLPHHCLGTTNTTYIGNLLPSRYGSNVSLRSTLHTPSRTSWTVLCLISTCAVRSM